MLNRIVPIILALFFLGACTPHIFGVPEEQWAQMTLEQRNVAMEAYHQQKKINAERRLAESRRAAEEAKKERIQADLAAKRDNYPFHVSHPQKTWRYGDMIRVTVDNGEMDFKGKYREYRPMSFTIARGQRKAVVFRRSGRKSHHGILVWVEYRNKSLYFDVGKRGRHSDHAQRINYGRRWKSGKRYKHLLLGPHTASQGRNISIAIRIISPETY